MAPTATVWSLWRHRCGRAAETNPRASAHAPAMLAGLLIAAVLTAASPAAPHAWSMGHSGDEMVFQWRGQTASS